MPLLLLFLALPMIEIALFVVIGDEIGVLATLLWVIASFALGFGLLRTEPQRSAIDLRVALARDIDPASPMAHSALRLLAALLLIVPGFLTDAIGALLLVPQVRALALGRLHQRVQAARPARDDVIDGEYDVQPDTRPHLPRQPGPDLRD